MILGIGHDLVQTERIRGVYTRTGHRFLDRVFSAAEKSYALRKQDPVPTLAKRFAAKEACAKALGTGFGAEAHFREIEVVNDAKGTPVLHLSGRAAMRLTQITPAGYEAVLHLSLSDDAALASAFVVIEAQKRHKDRKS